jgi:hypothetical protein
MGIFTNVILLGTLISFAASLSGCSAQLVGAYGGTAPSLVSEDSTLFDWKLTPIAYPETLHSMNDRPRDLFRLQNTICYTAFLSNQGRKLFCLDAQGRPRKAFDLNPGSFDTIQNISLSGEKLYFASYPYNSSRARPYVFDGHDLRAIPLPNGTEVSYIEFFPGEGNLVYFRTQSAEVSRVFGFNGVSTFEILNQGTAPSNRWEWNPWGVYAGRLYFTAPHASDSNKQLLYSFHPEENTGQPLLVMETFGIDYPALTRGYLQDMLAPALPSSSSPVFIARDGAGRSQVHTLVSTYPANPVPVTGDFGPLRSNLLQFIESLGTCFTASSSDNESSKFYCITHGSTSATERISSLEGNPNICATLIPSQAGSFFYSREVGAGCSTSSNPLGPEIRWKNGDIDKSLAIASETRRPDFRILISLQGALIFSASDLSAEGKSLCSHGSKRLYSFDPTSETLTPITPPRNCDEGSAYGSWTLAQQASIVGNRLYFLEDGTRGLQNYGFTDGSQHIRTWDGSNLSSVDSVNESPYLLTPGNYIISTKSHSYTVAVDQDGIKLYRISPDGTASGWKRISNIIPGGADPIPGGAACGGDHQVLFSTYEQGSPGSGSGSNSRLWVYDENTDSVQLISSIANFWGSPFTMNCLPWGDQILIQIGTIDQNGNSNYVSYGWNGSTLARTPLPTGDAVTGSNQPLTDALNTGFFNPLDSHRYFMWPDQNGHQKLFSIDSSFVTRQISNIYPNKNDHIENVVTAGDSVWVTHWEDWSGEPSPPPVLHKDVYMLKNGNYQKTNLSVEKARLMGIDSGSPKYEKLGNDINLHSTGAGVIAHVSRPSPTGETLNTLYRWSGAQFIPIDIPAPVNLWLVNTLGEFALFSGLTPEGTPLFFAVQSDQIQMVDASALGTGTQIMPSALIQSSGGSGLFIQHQGDDVGKLFRLSRIPK